MLSEVLEDAASVGAEDAKLDRLCANLADGLHAMAQPLTILRSALAAAPSADGAGRARYLTISGEQIERLCGLFERIQDLVISSQNAADCLPFDLAQLLSLLLKDQRAAIKGAGVQLSVAIEDNLRSVVGDTARTEQAVLAALDIAAGTASKGDVIEVLVASRNGFAELAVSNDRAHGKALNSTQRLSLSLAAANIQSQHGQLEWADDPFRVSLALPLQGVSPEQLHTPAPGTEIGASNLLTGVSAVRNRSTVQ
jgi:hypothetical protein